ncbi:hypothetical protein [Pseudarthrobacter sp. L1SW]|uniref:hypothetical protein n=1 Tax=Pseudarthrobacter sp. L1SW TaxID=2851598 RepID=UPI001E3C4DC4|nr:hypothetical protein [Pseudarthrobacter sp. L1SW]UEL30236.1 hypothetical protein KTR40_09225 [Pseudarthrobacter sp. L1SW]
MSAGGLRGQGNYVFQTSRRWPWVSTPDLVKLRRTLQRPRDFVDSDEAGKLLRPTEQELHHRTREPNCPQDSRPTGPE